MKTRVETMFAPAKDYYYQSEGVPHGCRPIVHIPEEPPKCFVTLLHGFTSCPDEFSHFLPDLAASGCLVVVPVFPGHGLKDGGGRPNIPGFRTTETDRKTVPEPEKYFQFVFDVAQILSDAGVSSLPNKTVGGSSLGGSAAAMLALVSDVGWDRALIMNGAFKIASPGDLIAFNLPYRTKLSWNSLALWDIRILNQHTCRGEDLVTANGYCDFYASSMVSLFQFGHVVMGFWEAVPLFRQGLEHEAVEKLREMRNHVLEMGGDGGSMRAWDGQHWRFTPHATDEESSWVAWERQQPDRLALLDAMLARGARHIARSEDMTIQVIGCGEHGKDGAVSPEGLSKFLELATADGRETQTHFCAFPGGANGLPHPWTRPYIDPDKIFWWNPYSRVAFARFALHGEPFQKETRSKTETGTDQTSGDVCFVDAIADGDAEHEPFIGQEYTARYPVFEGDALLEQWKEFSFLGSVCTPGLGCGTHMWRMGRPANHFWSRRDVFAVQPLTARLAGASDESIGRRAQKSVPMLVERGEPADWSDALRMPIRAAWVKAHGDCEDVAIQTELASLAPSEQGACLLVPLRSLMADGRSGDLAKNLLAGGLYASVDGSEESTMQFCGKVSELTVLRQHICYM